MNKTKIDWCDMSWNPVTGCLHNCEYCYARKIARRFSFDPWQTVEDKINHFIGGPMRNEFYKGNKIDPYPYGFDPTFHYYRLNEPAQKTKPRNIFVCSMADLFGDWVPDEWIQAVFAACEAAPQHRYIFLTKNPGRYGELYEKKMIPCKDNYWFGTTITNQEDSHRIAALPAHGNRFVSIEPIMGSIKFEYITSPLFRVGTAVDWVIIGAETGNRKEKVIPQRSWIESIVNDCRAVGIPIFMKSSLSSIWGEPLIQEFPWEDSHGR